MGLRQCVECGRSVSDSVSTCPACHTSRPWGVSCELCGGHMRPRQGLAGKRLHTGVDPYYEEVFAHEQCVCAHYTLPPFVSCRDCGLAVAEMGRDLSPVTLWREWQRFTCPRCGGTDVLSKEAVESRRYGSAVWPPVYDFQLPAKGGGCLLIGAVILAAFLVARVLLPTASG